jgi:selenocysteine-specific elongation factor
MKSHDKILSGIIGTAGHIDHGKTTLVEALTGIHTDRLPEEKARGMSIDLGFAPLEFADGKDGGQIVSIIDVPGHERFIKNMVAGANAVDVLLLVIAADEGIKPQTIEHVEIARLLGIKHAVVAITKIDELANLTNLDSSGLPINLEKNIRQLIVNTTFAAAPILKVSAKTSAGLKELKSALKKLITAPELTKELKARRQRPFRMYIDRVFSKPGFGTIVTGSCYLGSCQSGDELLLAPHQLSTTIRKVEAFLQELKIGSAGMRLALNLQHVDKEGIERGDCLTVAENIQACDEVIVHLQLAKNVDGTLKEPIQHNSWVKVHWGCNESRARLLNKNFALLKFDTPVLVKFGDRMIIRNESPLETLAGAQVLVALSEKNDWGGARWEAEELATLIAALHYDDQALTAAIVMLLARAGKRGVRLQELANFFDLPLKQMALQLEEELLQNRILTGGEPTSKPKAAKKTKSKAKDVRENHDPMQSVAQAFLMSATIFQQLCDQVKVELERHASKNPADPVMNQAELCRKLGKNLEPSFFTRALDQLSNHKESLLVLTKDGGVALRAAVTAAKVASQSSNGLDREGTSSTQNASPVEIKLPTKSLPIAERMTQLIRQTGLTPPNVPELAALLNIPVAMAGGFAKSLLRDGAILKLPGELYMHRETLALLEDKMKIHFNQTEALTIGEFKTLLGVSRKYTVPMLEFLDQEKYTLRLVDDRRKAGPKLKMLA